MSLTQFSHQRFLKRRLVSLIRSVTHLSSLQVFEGTKHLIQSAIDGFNVCIFAYGQTGSGKTFTIYGSDDNPGLTPKGIFELFNVIERDSNKYTATVKCYMLELYTDYLVDLLAPEKQKKPVDLLMMCFW